MTLAEALTAAIAFHHTGGNRIEAQRLCQAILNAHAEQFEALHYFGVREAQRGQLEPARCLLTRALEVDSRSCDAHLDLGNVLTELGRCEEALASYDRALALRPDNAQALSNRGNVLLELRRYEEALASQDRALELQPDHAEGHYNRGNVLQELGLLEEAAASYGKALALRPDFVDALVNLGNVRVEQTRYDEARALLESALQLAPDNFEVRINMGNLYAAQEFHDEAAAWYRKALEAGPGRELAWHNLASTRLKQREPAEAIRLFRRALEIDNGNAATHFGLAESLLLAGQYEEGWRELEWRWRWKKFTSPQRNFTQPQWLGEDIAGKTILLHPEQGFGDMLHFVRYVPLVGERGAKVVLEAPRDMMRLMRASMSDQVEVVRYRSPLPVFDVHCPLLSLPLVFGTRLDTIPWRGPYLRAPAELTEKWRARLAAAPPGLRVGLAWAGGPAQANDRARSMALKHLGGLSGLEGVRFYGIQKGDAGRQPVPQGLELVPLGEELEDFADTAGLVMNLDLIITVDTALAHLAGGLGKTVWTLLTVSACWRYLLEREDSPWYPTMRLYRQRVRGDWDDVIARARADLQSLVSSGSQQ